MKIIQFTIVLLLFSCSRTSNYRVPDLQLGKPDLDQKVTYIKLARGLHFIKVKRGKKSMKDFYTLSSGVISEKQEIDLIKKLNDLGYSPRIETSVELGPHNESLGNIIRVGKDSVIEHIKKIEKKLKSHDIHLAIRHTSEDGAETTGPFDISILEIDLHKFKGNIFSELGKSKIKEKELTSLIGKKHNALAAINAGFFAWKNTVGIEGEPAGISIIDGNLVSEATNGRAALIIDNNHPKQIRIAHNLRTNINLSVKNKIFRVNGINREPGKILNCGNQTDSISIIPIHDYVCYNPNEIIVFNTDYGETSNQGDGIEFRVNGDGKVLSKSMNRGGRIPKRGYNIQAIGTWAEKLKQMIKKGDTIKLDIEVLSTEGAIDLKKGIYAVNGGPTLIHNGSIDISSRYKEGFETQFKKIKVSDKYVDKKDKASITDTTLNNRNGFYHGWVVRRHPRTAIGITKDNKVFIAVVYGRQPGKTAGASITEMTKLMQQLGCYQAFNLDGGGSSMMVVDDLKTGNSSDIEGERAVGDAIIITK